MIHEQLRSHCYVTMQLLWEEYHEANPDGYRYSRRFCELNQRWRKRLEVVTRQEHKAGEKAGLSLRPTRTQSSTPANSH